jgi:hypothetical protein
MHRFGLGFTVRSARGDSGEEEGGELSCERQLDGGCDCTSREILGLNHGSIRDQHFQLLPWRFRLTDSLPEHLCCVEAHLLKYAQQALPCSLGSGLHGGNPRTPARCTCGTVATEHQPVRPVHLPIRKRLGHAHPSRPELGYGTVSNDQ